MNYTGESPDRAIAVYNHLRTQPQIDVINRESFHNRAGLPDPDPESQPDFLSPHKAMLYAVQYVRGEVE